MIRCIFTFITCILLFSCSTSSENSQYAVLELKKSETDVGLPTNISELLVGKRRGKLDALKANGSAWFNFSVGSFQKLTLTLYDGTKSHELVWNGQDDTSFVFSEIDPKSEQTNIDIFIQPGSVWVYFNEGTESFFFQSDKLQTYESVSVMLEDTRINPRGIVYDLKQEGSIDAS